MYDQLTNSDLIVVAYEKAHPSDNPSSETAELIDELCSRLRKTEKELQEMEDLLREAADHIETYDDGMAGWKDRASILLENA